MSARAVRWSSLRKKPVEVGHVEHDPAKLLDLYIQGRQEAKRLLAEIQEFVER